MRVGRAQTEQLLLDGGMGHLLKQDKSLRIEGLPYDEQSVASAVACCYSPEAVIRAHQQYIDAGCNVITTNSFSATPYHFKRARRSESYVDVAVVRSSARSSSARLCSMADLHVHLPDSAHACRSNACRLQQSAHARPGGGARLQTLSRLLVACPHRAKGAQAPAMSAHTDSWHPAHNRQECLGQPYHACACVQPCWHLASSV
jgi:Homocysteine S-methyltransferase